MPFVVGVIVKNYLFEGMVSIDCNSWMRKNCPKKKFWVDRRDFLVIIDKKMVKMTILFSHGALAEVNHLYISGYYGLSRWNCYPKTHIFKYF